MNDVTRDRIWRKLEALPDAQLYEVLDYIEFIEQKYAPGRAARPDGLQRFAERLEDGMRMRSVAPKIISGAVGVLGTARKMVRSVTDAGRDLLDGVTRPVSGDAANGAPPAAAEPARQPPQLPRRAGPDGAATAGDDAADR